MNPTLATLLTTSVTAIAAIMVLAAWIIQERIIHPAGSVIILYGCSI